MTDATKATPETLIAAARAWANAADYVAKRYGLHPSDVASLRAAIEDVRVALTKAKDHT